MTRIDNHGFLITDLTDFLMTRIFSIWEFSAFCIILPLNNIL
jgi:hypothetical protein